MISKIKLKLRKTRKGQERGRIIDSGALKDEGTKAKYCIELLNRFSKLEGKEAEYLRYKPSVYRNWRMDLGLQTEEKGKSGLTRTH